tara:strand:+ start:1107 stop:1586 length:480 start_codon:yes stop_codon:yes gene_type:complete
METADVSANQVLKTDGSGALGWADGHATYTVNTFYADLGGYVIEVRNGGKQGLVVAMQDQSSSVQNFSDANSLINKTYYHDADGGEFIDWRLPTKRELNLIYDHFSSGGNAAGLGNGAYMSSSLRKISNEEYWWLYFGNGSSGYNGMSSTNWVRAVRAF